MSALDELLADPVDVEHGLVRSLPAVVYGVLLPAETACGIVSRSAGQTAWAVKQARHCARPQLGHLTDGDVLWLLLMGWAP